jgi:prepilin-type N-terminal cleavage/methylation domain-containing protein
MKTNKWNKKGFTLVELLVVIAIIASLAGLATPVILKARKSADRTTAISNAKQVYSFLTEFERDFSSFPSPQTVADDPTLSVGGSGSSNSLLGQLIVGGYSNKSERVFWVKGGTSSNKRADDIIEPSNKILEAGECSFAYTLKDSKTGFSTSDSGGIPILMVPMTGNGYTFNNNPFDNRGVYLKIDGSVLDGRIDPQKLLRLDGGKTLFDTSQGSVWSNGDTKITPVVIYPKGVTASSGIVQPAASTTKEATVN